ncbi:class I SAM-dependent methyltransferase [Pedobacter endophyticus]|uniref:Class I SAM-dependent methyltransferase n=1 Tax=Pedobacter endophyticus TaxID=2789740 RepID=A0A7U3SPV7_9SPHI|nr:methyltransferase domain-containing protein [Pedobacter endophyticus]QPH37646.1 class I SAM-dependent methyltransferase [Pedobacter endophyticus]
MDVFGKALSDIYNKGEADTLWLHNSYGEPEEMPLEFFFRDDEDMPVLELQALKMCSGKVLDVGAGVGSHALLLQAFNIDVTAIDISEAAVEIMKDRGVKKAFLKNVFSYQDKFDTVLMLMNGIGLTGTLAGFKHFLIAVKNLLNPGGQLIFDSSDIAYLYEDMPKPQNQYYGEVSYQYEYQGEKGKWFNWVYVDEETIKVVAQETGWNCEVIFDDGEDQYLVRLTLN